MSIIHRELVENWLENNQLVWDEKHNHINELQALIGNEGRVFEAPQAHLLHILFNDNCKGDIDILTGELVWIEQDRMEGQTNNTPIEPTPEPTENPHPDYRMDLETIGEYVKPTE